MSAAEFRRKGNLGDGMVIVASVRARLFGMQLLKLDADITVSPTPPRVMIERSPRAARRRPQELEPPASNGSVGNGLEAVARSLEDTTRQLNSARKSTP